MAKQMTADEARCVQLRDALKAAKARMYAAPVRAGFSDTGTGMAAGESDSLRNEIDQIERALHQACGF